MTAREVLMIVLRGIGVLSALRFVAALALLPFASSPLASERELLVGFVVVVCFHAAAAVVLFIYPDRLAERIGRRLDNRLSAFAYAIFGIVIILEFTPFLVNNLAAIAQFGLEDDGLARHFGYQNDPISIAIQIVAVLLGLALVAFAKNFAEWTDWDWWRQRAFEDAQR